MCLIFERSFGLGIILVANMVLVFCGLEDASRENSPPLDEFLYAITLEGVIYQVSFADGSVSWSLNENKILETQVPSGSLIDFRAVLIPNPTDGSLHLVDPKEAMYAVPTKLPVTIQQLVQGSPYLHSEGIIQLGYKKDVWLEVSAETGQKLLKIDSHPYNYTCPEFGHADDSTKGEGSASSIVLSRSEFSLVLINRHDLKSLMNITYSLYNTDSKKSSSFSDHFFLSSTSGDLACVSKTTGKVLWKLALDSLVVHLFFYDKGLLRESHIAYVSPTVMKQLKIGAESKDVLDSVLVNKNCVSVIRKHVDTYYAIQSYDDHYHSALVPLTEGSQRALSSDLPSSSSLHLFSRDVHQDDGDSSLHLMAEHLSSYIEAISSLQHPSISFEISAVSPNSAVVPSSSVRLFPSTRSTFPRRFIVTTFVVLVSTTAGYYLSTLYHKVRATSTTASTPTTSTAPTQDDISIIGKITFNTSRVLGHGCDGTFVFEGTFDDRPVAVKRILSSSMELANREIKLLRESDQHPNVIRYYCTEKDSQFFYIAIELCQFNLHQYITDDNIEKSCFEEMDLLQQMVSGLNYLHGLRIVHRDIKPHNVLISVPDHRGRHRALLSDFGLCRKLSQDKACFTYVTATFSGTQGWMAPEMFRSGHQITSACDIFSMGCVLYFVMSHGKHPFGDELMRQSNINQSIYDISCLLETPKILEARHLLLIMIHSESCDRPSAESVLAHSYFWPAWKRCQFVQDMSNYTEKLSNIHPFILGLEMNAIDVVRGSWVFHIPVNLQEDMLQYRRYSQGSVRDLLRAIRNKMTHFKETPEAVRSIFDNNPENIVGYFSTIFPKLMLHLYQVMHNSDLRSTPSFRRYYVSDVLPK